MPDLIPDAPRTSLAQARALQQAGAVAESEALSLGILGQQSRPSSDCLALLALCRLQLGRRGDAAEPLARSRLDPPTDREGLSDLGAALFLAGETTAARAILESVAVAPDANAIDANRLATACIALGDLDAAEQALRAAIRRRPGWAAAHNNLAGVQMRRLQPADALASYDRAIALDPANPQFPVSRDTALVALGRGEEALAAATQALMAQPEAAHPHRRLAELYRLLDRDREAEAHLRTAMRLAPEDTALPLRLADLLLRGHRPEAASRVLEVLLVSAPDNEAAIGMLGNAYVELGLSGPAHKLLAQLCARDPDSLVGQALRARLATLANDHLAASRELQAAVARHPDAVDVRLELGENLMALGRMDEALSGYRELAPIKPDALAALAELNALPDREAAVARMAGLAASQATDRSLRTTMCFGLCRVLDREGDHDHAFRYADLGNRLQRIGSDYSAARQSAAVDRIIETFTPELFARLRGAGSPSTRPVFVCGMPRSGTTLAEQLLAAHDSVHGAGELGAIPQLAATLHEGLGTAIPYPRCMALFTAETARRAAARILASLDEAAPGARRVVDKLPHNFLHLGLIALLFPKARIVHLNRHPGDVALSTYFTNFRQKRGMMGYAMDLGDIAAMIRDHDRLMAHWRRVLPIEIHELSYEALVADFDSEARALYAFVGLKWQAGARRFHALDRPVRTGSVWQVRQPLYSSSMGRWRAYARQLAPFADLLGKEHDAV